MLNRYEATRLIGLRSIALSEGAPQTVVVDPNFRENTLYIAALELFEGTLDALIERNGQRLDVRMLRCPPCVSTLLDTIDGGNRG